MIKMFAPYVSERGIERVVQTLRSGRLTEGPVVRELEELFKDKTGAPFPLAVNSCTSALHLALILAGVKPGDEVITTAQTMMATSHAILMTGAKPVFADVEYLTGNLAPQSVEDKWTLKTKAILVVHWGGYPCDMPAMRDIADDFGVVLIEDAAHVLGAKYQNGSGQVWSHVGFMSADFSCFSLQAIKHVTSVDGGVLCVPNETTYDRGRRLRWYGIDRQRRQPSILGEAEWTVMEVGYKYHMNDVAASLGVEHLKELHTILSKRTHIAQQYWAGLVGVPGVTMFEYPSDRTHARWLFDMHVERREDFCRAMRDRGVEASVVHRRIDIHPVFGGRRDDLPNLDKFDETHICLPLHTNLTDEDVQTVITAVRKGW